MPRLAQPLLLLALGLVAGCGTNPGQVADPVPVTGKVTLPTGKPAAHAALYLQPMDDGLPAGLVLGADGQFRAELVPGKYAYYFAPQEGATRAAWQKSVAALKQVPQKYRQAHRDNTIVVRSGSVLDIKLD